MCVKGLSEKDFWMVRAGAENELIDSFYENGQVAIGWREIGNLSDYETFGDLEEGLKKIFEDKNTRQISGCAGQLFRFAYEIEEGDIVLTYNQTNRTYLVGEVNGPYLWNPLTTPDTYPHVREVNWRNIIHRDEFDQFSKNTLGSSLTVFSLKRVGEYIGEIISESDSESVTSPEAQL